MEERRLCVAVSGKGSILAAMIEDDLPISLVLADRECRGLEIAKSANIPTALIKRVDFTPDFDRVGYSHRVVEMLQRHRITDVAMAGYMTILEYPVFRYYPGRIYNTHPSLLPEFKGDHAVKDALEAGVKVTGCNIHIATKELDAGPVLAQMPVEVLPGDTEETLHERIKEVERKLYPQVLRRLLRW